MIKILGKKYLCRTAAVLSALTVIFLAVLIFSKTSSAGIVGSPHDFSYAPVFPSDHGPGEICKVCHVPHNAGTTDLPLWRGSLGSNGTYTLYSSDTLDATVNQPMVPTKACLSCHDSTIGRGPLHGSCLDCHSFHGNTLNLAVHHPVSFTYDTTLAQADGALHDPSAATVPSLGGKTIQQGMLYQNRMECASCHDVHATKGDSTTAPNLLLVANNRSRLCLTCHNK